MFEVQGAAYEYINKKYGGLFRPIETAVAVDIGITSIVDANPDRVELVFVGIGAQNVWVFMTQQGFPNSFGIRVAPAGGQVSFNVEEDSIMPAMQWFGRADVAISNLFVIQIVRDVAL